MRGAASALAPADIRPADRQWLWQEYAVSYDRILLQMPYYRRTLDRHLRALDRPGVRTVVDLGAGTGNLALRMLARGWEVTAVDSSRTMLDKLREKLAGASWPERLHLVEQSAEALPRFADGSFDAVTILLALFDMDEPRRALDEAIRIVRPGGWLVVTEPRAAFAIAPILRACRRQLRRRGLLVTYGADLARITHVNRRLDPGRRVGRSPLRAEHIHDLLRDLGFGALRTIRSHFGNCATIVGQRPR